jgi:hypothetical protein
MIDRTLPTLDDVATDLGLTVPGLAKRLHAFDSVIATCSERSADDCEQWRFVSLVRADGWVCEPCRRPRVPLLARLGG